MRTYELELHLPGGTDRIDVSPVISVNKLKINKTGEHKSICIDSKDSVVPLCFRKSSRSFFHCSLEDRQVVKIVCVNVNALNADIRFLCHGNHFKSKWVLI